MRDKQRSVFWLAASVLLLGAFISGALEAQAQAPPLTEGPATKQPENDLRYATEQHANSGFAFEIHTTSSWDDNIFGNNAHRASDYVFQEGGMLDFWKKQPGWSIDLTYRPNALLYRTYSGLNQLDHRLDFANDFHIASHVVFRLKDSLDSTTGVLEPQANQDLALPVGGPTNLNSTVLAPLARQFANEASGEVEYDASRRGTIRISGGHGFRRFTNVGTISTSTNVAGNLFSTQSDVGSMTYEYRLTRHFTGGLIYEFENYRFGRGLHDKTQSGLLRVLWDVRPHITLSLFGGPQYSDSNGLFSTPSTNPLQPGNVLTSLRSKAWGPSGGGSITLRSNRTVFSLSARQQVSDGGGLLAAVTSSFEAAEIRRRLALKWDAALTLSNARAVALEGPQGKGTLDSQTVGITLEHPLAETLNLHLEYDYVRQRANSFVPFPINLDRNRFTLGLLYRPHDYRF